MKLKQYLSATLLAITMTGVSVADEASLKKAIEAAYPKFKVGERDQNAIPRFI